MNVLSCWPTWFSVFCVCYLLAHKQSCCINLEISYRSYWYYHRFEALIEREWIQAGHQFKDRCGKSVYSRSEAKSESPIFLLFLDSVWQVKYSESWSSCIPSFRFETCRKIRVVPRSKRLLFGCTPLILWGCNSILSWLAHFFTLQREVSNVNFESLDSNIKEIIWKFVSHLLCYSEPLYRFISWATKLTWKTPHKCGLFVMLTAQLSTQCYMWMIWSVRVLFNAMCSDILTHRSCLVDKLTFYVLQIWQQFPCSFEFNENFLIMLFENAYCSKYGEY